MQVTDLKIESNMKEELLEAIYGTVERLEQKVDELSASPKNTEAESTPASVRRSPESSWLLLQLCLQDTQGCNPSGGACRDCKSS